MCLRGKYRGITLLGHVFKLLEIILDRRIWEKGRRVATEIEEAQQCFRWGRGTGDDLFLLR